MSTVNSTENVTSAMSGPASIATLVPGLGLHDYNYLKCWVGLIRVGKQVLLFIFKNGYIGDDFNNIKATLFENISYDNKRYRSEFDSKQRKKIESANIDVFDISLLYLLLQRVCQLPPPTDPIWVTSSNIINLPNLLYLIKIKRNDFAHPSCVVTQNDMAFIIDEIKVLFKRAIAKSTDMYNILSKDVDSINKYTNDELDKIKNSPLPANTVLDQLQEIAHEKTSILLSEGKCELTRKYSSHTRVSLAPWPLCGNFMEIQDIYTDLTLRFSPFQVCCRQMSEQESLVKVEDILITERSDGALPNFILITGTTGMGKTTLTKYIIDNWIRNSFKINGLDLIDLILYMDCRGATVASVEDLFTQLMPTTLNLFGLSEFKAVLLSMNLLIIFDNLNELSTKSMGIFQEVIQSNSKDMRILATTNNDTANEILRKTQHKSPLRLELEGIADNQIHNCVTKLHSVISAQSNEDSMANIDGFISKCLNQQKLQDFEHLRSPEILTHLFHHWLSDPSEQFAPNTVTQLFLRSMTLQINKIKDRISFNTIPGVFEAQILQSKLLSFVAELGSIATLALRSNQVSLESKNVSYLVNMCRELGLEENTILTEFLCFQETVNKNVLISSINIMFPSKSIQEFYSAYYVTQQIKKSDLSTSIKDLIFGPEMKTENLTRIKSAIKFLVGLLNILMPEHLSSRANEIVTLLKRSGVLNASEWMYYIEEAKSNEAFVTEVRNNMDDSWIFEDFEISDGILNMFQEKPPYNLSLTACINPNTLPHILPILNKTKETPNLDLTLHLYYHFWIEKSDNSDKYFKIIANSSCNLKSFAGRLSSELIYRLPSGLTRLALHVIPDNIPALSSVLPKMTELNLLYLNFDVTPDTPAKNIKRIKLPKNLPLAVDMWKITSKDIPWACDIAKALSSKYSRLVLRRTDLDQKDVAYWLSGLANMKVTARSCVIGSTQTITPEEEENLVRIASKCGCNVFKWLKIGKIDRR